MSRLKYKFLKDYQEILLQCHEDVKTIKIYSDLGELDRIVCRNETIRQQIEKENKFRYNRFRLFDLRDLKLIYIYNFEGIKEYCKISKNNMTLLGYLKTLIKSHQQNDSLSA